MHEDQVIAYASRQLRPHETDYPIHDSEWLQCYLRYCLEIVIVWERSSDSLGPLESEIYFHSLKLVLGQCSWIEFVAGYSLDIAYHLVRTTM